MAYGRLIFDWLLAGVECRTALGFRHDDGAMPSEWHVPILSAFAAAWETLDGALPTQLELRGAWYIDVTGAPPYPPQQYAPLPLAGANTSGIVPHTVASTVSLVTQDTAIRGGHINFPGVPKEFVVGTTGLMHDDMFDQLSEGLNEFRTSVLSAEYTWQVLRMGAGVQATTGAQVKELVVRRVFGTQRSRKLGSGI